MKNKKLNSIQSAGFKIPEDYLETFDDLLLNKLKNTNPIQKTKNSGFKVPEQYFESFDDRLAKALDSEKEVKVIPLLSWKKLAYISGLAASIILMVGLFNNYNSTPDFGDLETVIIENYIVDEDFSNEDIGSLLSDDLTLNNFMDSHLIDSNLEDYILNNASVEDYLKE